MSRSGSITRHCTASPAVIAMLVATLTLGWVIAWTVVQTQAISTFIAPKRCSLRRSERPSICHRRLR